MIKFNKNQDPPKRFDVRKSLPQSYTPESRNTNTMRQRPEPAEKPKKRKWIKRTAFALVLLIIFPIVFIGAWDAKNASSAAEKMFGSGNLMNMLAPASLDDDNGRVNVLIAGFSADDPGHGGAELTDSIMVMSLDKKTHKGYMLSIPRDLYIDIPGVGYKKINEAYYWGKQNKFSENGYPKGGMGLLEKTISEKMDIKISNYFLINYGAVKDVVKALGGIKVTIKSNDPRGIYDPNFKPNEGGGLKLSNGTHKINASQALRLTRARGSTYGSYGLRMSDFDRTKNQREVIKGIKEKLTYKKLLDPRINKPIFDAFAKNIKTDLKLNEVLPLYRLFNSVPEKQLKSVGFRTEKTSLLSSYRTPTGQSALIPNGGVDNYTEINSFINKLNN